MVLPETGLDRAGHDEVALLDTSLPQPYGMYASLGVHDYGVLLAMTERFQLLTVLHRSDKYVRNELACEPHYVEFLRRWLDGAEPGEAFLGLREAVQSSAAYIRLHLADLANEAASLLRQCTGCAAPAAPHLPELVRVDLTEAAMKQRYKELVRDLHPMPFGPRVLFADEAAQRPWMLSDDVWLERHRLPNRANQIVLAPQCFTSGRGSTSALPRVGWQRSRSSRPLQIST